VVTELPLREGCLKPASRWPRTLSVEALQELQILTTPFDVRYGNFAGGLVNAVTRSGSTTGTLQRGASLIGSGRRSWVVVAAKGSHVGQGTSL
jgi:hypothetical protein